ncbi:MAG TPA: type II toxin-antitoxin system VapC family toxin [Candidatus Saccharimonadales bacterium]|nr:type II toxin-antitoxin system VapC family toxin [Candidatus Saccharimonadales bacterium]
MSKAGPVFIDANVLIYFLDETATQHEQVVSTLQRLHDTQTSLYTSHHVLEEVLFIVSRLSKDKDIISVAIQQIADIPNLNLVEPAADFGFALSYAKLYKSSKIGINDTLLLQLMLDADIKRLFSYDEKFLKQADSLTIQGI